MLQYLKGFLHNLTVKLQIKEINTGLERLEKKYTK